MPEAKQDLAMSSTHLKHLISPIKTTIFIKPISPLTAVWTHVSAQSSSLKMSSSNWVKSPVPSVENAVTANSRAFKTWLDDFR